MEKKNDFYDNSSQIKRSIKIIGKVKMRVKTKNLMKKLSKRKKVVNLK